MYASEGLDVLAFLPVVLDPADVAIGDEGAALPVVAHIFNNSDAVVDGVTDRAFDGLGVGTFHLDTRHIGAFEIVEVVLIRVVHHFLHEFQLSSLYKGKGARSTEKENPRTRVFRLWVWISRWRPPSQV